MTERDHLSEPCRQLIERSDRLIARSRIARAECATLTAQLAQFDQPSRDAVARPQHSLASHPAVRRGE
jgi:hypothetical protein